jgi:tetratricopeptide (TPR) repeat protein
MFRAPEPARGIVFASRRNERSGRAWYSQGMDLHHEGRYARAIEAFRHAIELGYREDDASYNIACGYALSGDKDRAFEWLGKARDAGFELDHYLDRDDDLDALREDPRFAALEKSLGVDDRRARRKERLAERFDRLSGSGPHSGQGYESLGRELLDARDFDRAAKAFAEAARLGYREGTSLYNQACALSRKGDRAAALDALERSLAAGFDSPHHFDHDDDLDNLRGERRFDELDDVAHDLTLSAGLDGGEILHRLLSNHSSWREAAERYRRRVSDKTFGGRAAFDLGFAELKLNDPAAARDAFQKAYDLGYRKPTTMYNLACAYARLGEKDAAFDWLFKSIDAGFEAKGRLRHDEDLRPLRRDSRWEKALRIAEDKSTDEDD